MKIRLLPCSSQRGKTIFILSCLYWSGLSFSANAQPITLKQALQWTLQDNGRLKTYPLAIRGSEAMNIQAGLTPNPQLTVEVENALGTEQFEGFDGAQISLLISQVIELGDKRDNRVRYANAKTQKLKSEYEKVRLSLLVETSRRFYRMLVLQAKSQLLKSRLQQENKALKIVEKLAKAGAVGQADVSKMALTVGRTYALQTNLKNQQRLAQMQMTAMWMEEAQGNELATGDLSDLPELPQVDKVQASIANWPSVKQQRALQQLAAGKLKLARSNGTADVTLGVGIRQHQESGDQSLNFSFSMPLAIDNPNQGNIQAAIAEVDLGAQQTEIIKQQLKLSLVETYQLLSGYYQQVDLLKKQLLPQAKRLLAETERGYQQGRYSVLQWVDAQAELFSIEESIIDLYQNIYLSLLELERITGQSILSYSTQPAGEKS